MSHNILVVDDDPHIREIAGFALKKAGMQTAFARDGAEALERLKEGGHDLIVLDINMPELDGLEVCRQVRMASSIPILFLSSRDEEVDRVVGLEMGGDDYLTKPFSPREMVARVKAILKRAKPAEPPAQAGDAALKQGGLTLIPAQHLALFNGQPLQLTATEFEILQGFLKRPRHVLDRDAIMGFAYDFNIHVSDRTIDSHIRHIRQKLADAGCASAIETVHGVGYRLGSCQ
jgi:two-component system, OmpR family, response regulator